MTDEYAGWRALLAKEKIEVDLNVPFSGFYRVKRGRGGPFVPVAYWRQEGKIICTVDGAVQDDLRALELWPWCSTNPIPHDWFIGVTERGEPWPDVDGTVHTQVANMPRRGHNNPPTDDLETLREQIEAAQGGVDDYAKIEDDGTSARAQSLRARLLELSRTADKKREAEKKPHFDAAKAVDSKWQPLVKMAKEAADAIARAMSAWETEKLRREREAMRKAEEDARKAAEANQPAPPPPPAPIEAAPAVPIKGAYGRAASVKVVKVVTAITDQAALYGFLKDHPDLRDVMTKLAQRAVDRGMDVPGVTVEEQRKVA